MSGLRSRNKGKRGEREACEALESIFPGIQRTYGQSRGAEVPDIDSPNCPYWIEVKNEKSPNPARAWLQAQADADDFDSPKVPIAVTKGTRRPWLVTMHVNEFIRLFKLATRLW